jgi:hypothetical protein
MEQLHSEQTMMFGWWWGMENEGPRRAASSVKNQNFGYPLLLSNSLSQSQLSVLLHNDDDIKDVGSRGKVFSNNNNNNSCSMEGRGYEERRFSRSPLLASSFDNRHRRAS